MDEEIEIVDSGAMETVSRFAVEYDEEERLLSPDFTNIAECFIKTDDSWIVIATNSKGSPEAVGNVAFEIRNLGSVVENLGDVLNGKLRDEAIDSLTFKVGGDEMVFSADTVFPLNQIVPRERVTISNLREMELDGLEFMQLALPNKAAERLYEELKKLSDNVGEK